MKVNLLFGFLGSGKTTLAKHLLATIGPSERTAVIVNEFGEVGIDGEVLRGQHIDVVELNSGCLCCTLKGSLLLAVEELRAKARAERVIVEATGVAQPAELLESLVESSRGQRLAIGPLVTVVDSAKFLKLEQMLGDFYLDQIESADIVVMNKLDLAAPQQLTEATRRVRELNGQAVLLFAEQGRVQPQALFGEQRSELLERLRAEMAEAATRGHRGHEPAHVREHAHGHDHARDHDHDHRHDHDHDHDPHAALPAESFVVNTAGQGRRPAVEAFFKGLPDSVWRAKGFIRVDGRPSLVQYSLGQLEITPATGAAQPAAEAIVFIGHQVDRAAVEAGLAWATR
jgi:G3E family GTPase